MIISASYKTDIPAFYGEWFVNRLRAGYCGMLNPYSKQPYRVSMKKEDISGFVFWTKNLRPFLKYLLDVKDFGRPAFVQFTINGYPKELEVAVVDWRKSVDAARQAREILGDRSIVWRYDPITFTNLTSVEFHRDRFREIADSLAGITDEVVISFLQIYRKTKINMDQAASKFGNTWSMPPETLQVELAAELAGYALERGMKLTICSQPHLITTQEPSRCIDGQRLSDLAGQEIFARTKGNRPGCACAESKDIGDYDTCPHGCIYCYAVRNQRVAISRFQRHDPLSEFLFPVDENLPEIKDEIKQHRLDI